MRTFLQRDWRTQPQGHAQGEGAGQLRGVPLSFVTGVFLPSLIREHHYRGGGAEAEVVDVQVGGTRAVAPALRRVLAYGNWQPLATLPVVCCCAPRGDAASPLQTLQPSRLLFISRTWPTSHCLTRL